MYSTDKSLLDINIKIATFLGYKRTENSYLWTAPFTIHKGLIPIPKFHSLPKSYFQGDNSFSFDFHSNWNAIMVVLKYIESLDNNRYTVLMSKNVVTIYDHNNIPVVHRHGDSKEDVIFMVISDFIDQYVQNQKGD